jgi:hypothetical protein
MCSGAEWKARVLERKGKHVFWNVKESMCSGTNQIGIMHRIMKLRLCVKSIK